MSEKTELEDFVKHLQKGLEKLTIKEFNEILSTALSVSEDRQKGKEKQILLILDLVKEEYNITKHALIYSKERGSVQEARMIAYCILHFNLELPIRYIAKRIFFLKVHNSVGRAILHYNKLDLNIPNHRQFKDRLQRIQTSVIVKLKTQNK